MLYVGIDLGGTNIAAGLVSENGEILIKDSVPAGAKRSSGEIIGDMANLVKKLMADYGASASDISSIGIGSPGLIDSDNGVVLQIANLNLANVNLSSEMEKLTGIKTYVGNDANCAAYAEHLYGASKGANFSVMVTLGTGIGGGIILKNKVYTGHKFGAGEIGHLIIAAGGKRCGCGRRGCFEAYASATGLINMTKHKAINYPDSMLNTIPINDINGKTAFDFAKQGDEASKEVIDEYIYYLAVGIGDLLRILYPDVIVIGGGISKEGEHLLEPLRKKLREEVAFDYETKIVTATLGNDAGIVGAAMLEKTVL